MSKKNKLTFTRLSGNFEVVLAEDLNAIKGGGDSEPDWKELEPVVVTPPGDDDDDGGFPPPFDPEPEEPIEEPDPEEDWEDFPDNPDEEHPEELTPQDIWALKHPIAALQANKNATEARYMSSSLPGANRGLQDAYRHAYWMWQNEKDFGYQLSVELGVAHEDTVVNELPDRLMDLNNNEWGAAFGATHPNATLADFNQAFNEAVVNDDVILLEGPRLPVH
jgi:hypothetical protein